MDVQDIDGVRVTGVCYGAMRDRDQPPPDARTRLHALAAEVPGAPAASDVRSGEPSLSRLEMSLFGGRAEREELDAGGVAA